MKIRYAYKEIGVMAWSAIRLLCKGIIRLLWAIMLFPINIAATALKTTKNGICAAPLVAVGMTLAIGAFTCATIYADCRYKIETLTWQRDQNALKIDSMLILSGMKEAPKGWWQHYGK